MLFYVTIYSLIVKVEVVDVKDLEYPFDSDEILKKKKSIRKRLLIEEILYINKNIAILGGSTTNDVKIILELFLLNNGIKPTFYESEYNQYWQDAMFPCQALEDFKPDIIYVHTSIHNITSFPTIQDSEEQINANLLDEYTRFENMWDRISDVYQCPIIQNNFEYPFYRLMGNKDASDIHGRVNFITRLNCKFYEYAKTHQDFYINDINYLSASFGLEKWSAPFYWHMYKYSLCVPAIPLLTFNIANIVKSLYGKNKKAFVLDLDNTLWGGVIGDDGVDNISLGPETSIGQVYSEFQEYLKEHKHLGVLLTVNSKNDYHNALSGLNHPDSKLHPDEFINIKANWESKDKNLFAISTELNLLPESLVFIDDNPAERAIVSAQIPGVSVPEITTVENYINVIDKSGFFEVTNFSDDDLKRNEMYKENAIRTKQQALFSTYEDYLLSLEMIGTIKAFESVYMARISQLTNKSNQFNLTTKRYTPSDLEAILEDKNMITLYGKLEDKFGDNGVVSVVIGNIKNDNLHIDLWIMSCRVLKRNMEYAMMDTLIKHCIKNKVTKVYGYYYPTSKNEMVRSFYQTLGFTKLSEDNQGFSTWIFIIDEHYNQKNNIIKVVE